MRLPLEVLVERYKDNLYSAAFNVCRNPQDAEDVVQETYLAYHTGTKQYESEQHIRAWLLRVAINKAKNATVTFWRRNKAALDDYLDTLSFEEEGDRELVEAVMRLPERYRIALHLHYFEGYAVAEIADLLKVREGTVKSQLSRGRKLLGQTLKEEWT